MQPSPVSMMPVSEAYEPEAGSRMAKRQLLRQSFRGPAHTLSHAEKCVDKRDLLSETFRL
jgi:hypothetical protein